MSIIIKPAINKDYGPNNPEPQEMKDPATVRDPDRDALHAALEYISGVQSNRDQN